MANKQKRDRAPSVAHTEYGDIVSQTPTVSSPSARAFIPSSSAKDIIVSEMGAVLDWRHLRTSATAKERSHFNCNTSFSVENQIICGDANWVLSWFPPESVALIVTSPPYWNAVDYGFSDQVGQCSYGDYLMQLLCVWRECERILVPNGKLCINTPILSISKKVIADQHTRHLKNINNDIESTILSNLDLQRFSLYIWQKQTTEKMFGSYPYPPNFYERNTVEFINVFVKTGKPHKHSKEVKEASKLTSEEWMDLTKQVWYLYPADVKRQGHPAPFPESLPNRLIAMYSFKACDDFLGDIVLDPFCGIGATCIAAKKLGRRFTGIDLAPWSCIEAKKQVGQAVRDDKIFVEEKS